MKANEIIEDWEDLLKDYPTIDKSGQKSPFTKSPKDMKFDRAIGPNTPRRSKFQEYDPQVNGNPHKKIKAHPGENYDALAGRKTK